MSDIVIKAENLGKSYMIGHQSNEKYVALRDVITNNAKRWWSRIRNPQYHTHDNIEEFWALKDIKFEIRRGDRVGIIGRNGAGKSTLLKILSRITEPTTGLVRIKGRVASLLEVGTGFHPELTGRENIFLNGAILGMTKNEIKSRFDEIVTFAGVEKFLDTPVKRFSSGMFVRLAFAVAAHLEPEILIVDEVLAVGDVGFQKKCLGKMDDVAIGGRTILFVSHNMAQINRLCDRVLLIENGKIRRDGDVNTVIQEYLQSTITSKNSNLSNDGNVLESKYVALKKFSLYGEKFGSEPQTGKPMNLELVFDFKMPCIRPGVQVFIHTLQGEKLIYLSSTPMGGPIINTGEGEICFGLTIDELLLTGGRYILGIGVNMHGTQAYLEMAEICEFEVLPSDFYSVGIDLTVNKVGLIATKHKWNLKKDH